VGFVVKKVALGQVFSEYFGFSCQSSFSPTPLIIKNNNYIFDDKVSLQLIKGL
jgi:hypothetical protein